MKNYLHALCLAVLLLGWMGSCTSDSESDLIPEEPQSGEFVSFEADIESIINTACMPCHGNPTTNGAPQSLTSLEEVRLSVLDRDLIGRINNEAAPMPVSGLLPVATRELIQQWVDDGFRE